MKKLGNPTGRRSTNLLEGFLDGRRFKTGKLVLSDNLSLFNDSKSEHVNICQEEGG